MNIALSAHDSKKSLIENFAIAYRYILVKHNLYATETTGRRIENITNLTVHKHLSGPIGGEQQIGAQIQHNEIDLVIMLRDPVYESDTSFNANSIIHLCDVHNIPIATNLATAELLIKALERGDLDWRNLFR